MRITHLFRAALIAGVALLLMAASASATPITYGTSGAGTGFNGSSALLLNGTNGATLTFATILSNPISSPTGLSYGEFQLLCTACTSTTGASFAPFTFSLMVSQTVPTIGGGTFLGSSSGGTVTSLSNTLVINWSPILLGPLTNNALSGTFGSSMFTTTNPTILVALGTNNGTTSVQGLVTSTPEPMTFLLIGSGLVGLGLLRRKARKS
jgi:hypothetical protein